MQLSACAWHMQDLQHGAPKEMEQPEDSVCHALDLEWLRDLPDDDVLKYLISIDGQLWLCLNRIPHVHE